jgi:hypothetical protein
LLVSRISFRAPRSQPHGALNLAHRHSTLRLNLKAAFYLATGSSPTHVVLVTIPKTRQNFTLDCMRLMGGSKKIMELNLIRSGKLSQFGVDTLFGLATIALRLRSFGDSDRLRCALRKSLYSLLATWSLQPLSLRIFVMCSMDPQRGKVASSPFVQVRFRVQLSMDTLLTLYRFVIAAGGSIEDHNLIVFAGFG